jgi:DNA-binding response OmpR family regulator
MEEAGFHVDVAHDGDEARYRARLTRYEVIVLDRSLPGGDGLALLREWRGAGVRSHVVMLAAGGALEDRVRALDLGADDCLAKPFAPEELLARVRALVRRTGPARVGLLRVHDLIIDLTARSVVRGGRLLPLTPREYALLECLALHRGRVVTRSMVWEHVYGEQGEASSNVVDVYIRYLRNKVDRGFDTPLILTSWGKGYYLRGEEPAAIRHTGDAVRVPG